MGVLPTTGWSSSMLWLHAIPHATRLCSFGMVCTHTRGMLFYVLACALLWLWRDEHPHTEGPSQARQPIG